jgi:hypothetical protein
MKRPLWFRRHGLHWTPCAWQGWAVTAALTLCILAVVFFIAPTAPRAAVIVTVIAVALVIGLAAATDDTHTTAE